MYVSQIAAETSEAAATQDLCWPMHDLLFHRHKALEASNLREYAGQVGLDLGLYDQSLADRLTLEARVAEDVSSGTVNGVTGTPTIFLNDEPHAGSREFEPLGAGLIARAG